jgi:hypothetical protein
MRGGGENVSEKSVSKKEKESESERRIVIRELDDSSVSNSVSNSKHFLIYNKFLLYTV